MAETVTTLNRKRGGIQGQLTRISSSINEKSTIEELTTYQASLTRIQDKFDALKEEYYTTATDKEFAEIETTLSQLDDEIQKIEVSLRTSINKINSTQFKSLENVKTHDSNSVNSVEPKIASIKLPKIPLPTFSGKFDEWNLFKTQFNSLINENKDLSDNEKLHYLRGSLKGDAKSIETSDDSFNSLFKALELRYENRRIIVDTHMKNILNLDSVKHESEKELRNLLDTLNKNLRSLKALEFERDKFSNALLLNVILNKLDRETRKQYELTLTNNEVPDFDVFLEFLERRCQILSSISRNTKLYSERSKSFFVKSNKVLKACILCKNIKHPLYHCDNFKEMKLTDRLEFVRIHKLCKNCLSDLHLLSNCNSKSSCFVCKKSNHHTLLHKYSPAIAQSSGDSSSPIQENINNPTQFISSQEPDARVSLFINGNAKNVLINTAIVYARNSLHQRVALRAILDSASESSFITSSAADSLGLKKEKIRISVCGLQDTALNVKTKLTADISNENGDSKWKVELLVIPKIADVAPSRKFNISNLKIPTNIKLADPSFFLPQKIDLLLGAEFFFDFLKTDKIKVTNHLYLQSSCFGYLVSGRIPSNDSNISSNYCFLSKNLENLNTTLTSFWEIENTEGQNTYISEELKYCNEHFEKTHYRKADGRYVVQMPFKPELSENMLGNSKEAASKRLDRLWQRLEYEPTLKSLYSDFLREYELLGHMEEVKEDENFEEGYYIPHHGILRPTSQTTKLRVVFDASAKTTNRNSLNDLICKGGVIQEDLFSILIRFRKHLYAFTTDIEKMFRMIELDPSQTKLQKILWKDSKLSPTKIYQLKTVTYGTASAPYLATKVLHQLALDEEKEFPLASSIVLRDFYMDDCLSGSSDPNEFEKLQLELTQLLQKGGMTLHKWCTNKVPTTEQIFPFDRNSEEITVKTLGMLWNSSSDTFTYKVSINRNCSFTKRNVLSQIARIYDPLGLLQPVITKAKIFMQQLWLRKLNWNETLPEDLSQQWKTFIRTLPELESIKVPRCFLTSDIKSVIVHGFADASSRAYGAVIYIQVVTNTNELSSRLLCSKSRVAPLKAMTIPRLELSACLLLSQLVQRVLTALRHKVDSVQLWSDSTIALAWIRTAPHLLKTFVNNRVAQIQQLSKDFQWRHIPSECNPADFISRGLDADALAASKLWWHGPEPSKLDIPTQETSHEIDNVTDKLYFDELKVPSKLTLTLNSDYNFFNDLSDRTNNFHKLIRILGFIFRFYNNCRANDQRQIGALTREEFQKAEEILIKHLQVRYFASEISALQKGSSVPVKSKLRFLHPFLDSKGLIRVGGRLTNSNLSYNHKHPIVLPSSNKLVKLIFQYYHRRDLHVGPQALLNTVRQIYWPLGGRNIARQVVHECVQCFKMKPIAATQIMGDLPPERVICSTPFFNVGLDLCGPFQVKYKGQRKGTLQKVYVAIFVCMATKAVHLEFVSDLTSEALVATLKRFFARRGKSSTIFSDNATNFVGACAELKHLQRLVAKNEDISNFLVSEGIKWKFLPPRAPNFGGLWEAGVKAFKYHLKRVVGPAKLTLEEFLTVITQIEGILNSRPLTPLSTDTDDFQVLTPGHFLIGKSINSIPEPNLIDRPDNVLNRWQRSQKLVQTIWKRWQNNYLSHLQQRSKWLFNKQNVIPGMLVILKDSNLPIGKWPMARITKVIPGSDGNVRVVDLRTATGNFRRCVSKICILPIEDNYISLVK